MVDITNGISTFKVTNGAFENIFKNQGYRVKQEAESEDINYEDGFDGNPEIMNEVTNEDAEFVKEVSEKPISQWSKAEVKRFASIKSIDLSGTSSVNEAKDRIKAYLK